MGIKTCAVYNTGATVVGMIYFPVLLSRVYPLRPWRPVPTADGPSG